MTESKPTYVLQDWAIVTSFESPYHAPEQAVNRLTGKIYGREPRFKDGEVVTTSRIINIINDGEKYETRSSFYMVGRKDPAYELFLNGYNSEV